VQERHVGRSIGKPSEECKDARQVRYNSYHDSSD
jgi:hypothetical protein